MPSQADSYIFPERGKWKNFRLEGSLGSACYPLCRLVEDNLRGMSQATTCACTKVVIWRMSIMELISGMMAA